MGFQTVSSCIVAQDLGVLEGVNCTSGQSLSNVAFALGCTEYDERSCFYKKVEAEDVLRPQRHLAYVHYFFYLTIVRRCYVAITREYPTSDLT